MKRSTAVSAVFAVVAAAPFVVACDGLKKDGADAAVAVAPPPATPPATAPVADPPPAATPVVPLGGGVAPTPGVKPAAGDAGKPVEAGAADAAATGDAGKVPPGAPTPTLAIPTAIPGFDAGGFKPPPGFPSSIPTTLPTFPPPQK